MELLSARDLDLTSEDMDNFPPGMTLTVTPPVREYMEDPMWFDPIGRDPIRARKIFRRWDAGDLSREEVEREIAGVLDEWPRYGPAVFEKAAKEGRQDIIDILIEMNVESDPKTMRNQLASGDSAEDHGEDAPLLKPEHALLTAIANGHLDIVKSLVEKGGVPIDYEDQDDGVISVLYAVTERRPEMTRWLLEHGASVILAREDGISDVQAALRGGNLENLKMVLAHPHVVDANFKLGTDELESAASSRNVQMVRFVLQSEKFGIKDPETGLAGRSKEILSDENRQAVSQALVFATLSSSLETVRLLLSLLTQVKASGDFKPVVIPDDVRIQIFNATDDALQREEASELFEVLWDTVIDREPSQKSTERRTGLPRQEMLNRRLISAAALGRGETVKLLVEKYDADVNHVSHKYFSTPLGRSAGSGNNPLPGRLQVAQYLCSHPDINIELANGEFCNGETALAQAVQEAYTGKKRRPELADMVRLMLRLGGPVDEIASALMQRLESSSVEELVIVHVLWRPEERRQPVMLSLEEDEECIDVALEYKLGDLRDVLRVVKIRSDDKTLKATDPRRRPLMPQPGEQIPEEERAKQTLLESDVRRPRAAFQQS